MMTEGCVIGTNLARDLDTFDDTKTDEDPSEEETQHELPDDSAGLVHGG